MTERKGKGWNRRWAMGGGAAAALGIGYLAFRPSQNRPHKAALDPRTFYRGNGADSQTLDPSLVDSIWEVETVGDLMVGLMTENAAADPIPGMALSWTTSADGLVWTFKLREALWSDGVPVTADDFVFSWRRILDPKTASGYAYFLYLFKNAEPINAGKLPLEALGARALDDHMLELTLEHPAPYLLEMLMHQTLYPEPRHVIQIKGKDWARPGNYVGNGAFVLTEWVPNDRVVLEKNPRFFDAANVALEKVVFYPTDDYGAALRRLRAGELDIQEYYPSEQIGWIKANMPELIDPVPQLTIEFVAVNVKRKPFDDVRVRAAINMAINREMIVEKIRRGGEPPAYNLVPPGTANFPGGNVFSFKALPYAQRLEQARALMRDAGYGPNRKLELTYALRSTAPGAYRATAVSVQQALALLYIDMSILPFDASIFYNNIQEHDFDLAEAGWIADFNDASTFLELFQTGGGNNWGQYSNPEFDALMAVSQQDTDAQSRGLKLKAAEAVLLKDHAFMPIFFWVNANMVRPYVKGWVANKISIHRSRWVSFDQKARDALFT